jgi:uncharacterized membrane protein
MAIDFGKTFERTPEGIDALTWVLYIGSCGIAALTLGEISGTLLFLGCIAVIVLASSREKDAAGTIHESHLANIRKVMTVNLIAALVLIAVTWLTLGIGIILTWPIYLCFLIWTGFKLIRGLMKLNDGVGYL